MSRIFISLTLLSLLSLSYAAPGPRKVAKILPGFKTLAHGLRSGSVTIKDDKTIFIKGMRYDGAGPDAYFWVGKGPKPSAVGMKIPNEKGSYAVLEGYVGEDIELKLPGALTINDIDWLSVYCVAFREDFGHVLIPKGLNVPSADEPNYDEVDEQQGLILLPQQLQVEQSEIPIDQIQQPQDDQTGAQPQINYYIV